MDVQPNENFFELKLSQEGSASLLRVFKIVRRLFALALAGSLLFVSFAIFRFAYIDRYESVPDWQFQLEIFVSPIYVLVLSVLFLWQMYSYFHFARLCKKAIGLQQADLFNQSFKWLARHALLSLIIMIIEFIMAGFSFYVAVHMVQKYPQP